MVCMYVRGVMRLEKALARESLYEGYLSRPINQHDISVSAETADADVGETSVRDNLTSNGLQHVEYILYARTIFSLVFFFFFFDIM